MLTSLITAEALRWIGTPFAHQQRLRGVAVDCGQFVDAVYATSIPGWPAHQFGNYPPCWMKHQDREIYIEWAMSLGTEVESPQPGDTAVFRYGRCWSHGAIVIAWPVVVHADSMLGKVVLGDANQPPLARRKVRFFSPRMGNLTS